ncbi:hypothetical protein [Burkholderia cepacia]|uniref:hypothetical protein n=1 Tax=Burkholderia cepacia TaxID=292 RepID=UPI002AB66E88|nr:hypothetical protein [Burkholderia cepacia]
MSRTEGLRRVGKVIRITGLIWLAAFWIAAGLGMSHAVKEATAAHEAQAAEQAQLAKMSDAELIALWKSPDPKAPPRNMSPWYSRETAHIAFGCVAIGVVGALSAFALAWILDGFASPAKS